MRQLLINLDDLGMHPAINNGITEVLAEGVVKSTSVLAPGLYFQEAVEGLNKIGFSKVGVHLTLTSEYPKLPMRSLTGEVILSKECPTASSQLNFKKVEEELWAQIKRVQETGLEISHLDGHMFFYEEFSYGNKDLLNLVKKMARNLKVPMRNLTEGEKQTFFIWQGFEDISSRHQYYDSLFKELPFKKGELLLHPALNDENFRQISASLPRRVADHLYFVSNDYVQLAKENQVRIDDYFAD